MKKIPIKIFNELTEIIERQNILIQELTSKISEQNDLIDGMFSSNKADGPVG